jgi:hypothetical protein
MVRLDWEIESDRDVEVNYEEDVKERRSRTKQFLRFLLVIGVFLGLIAIVVFLVSQRLQQVSEWEERLLSQTVQAEVAALRIGNRASYMDLQRSASGDWIAAQQQLYENYQNRKVTSDVQITGRIVDVEIDGQRGRVQIEEIEQGTPYVNTWFYWHYDAEYNDQGGVEREAGWYHVPPDYTFWGEPRTIEREPFVIRYHALDDLFARQVADRLTEWVDIACEALTCGDLPLITVDITSTNLTSMRWAEGDAWQLIIPSPYVSRARGDIPFNTDRQIEAATLIAGRLVQYVSPNDPQFPYDADAIHESVVAWLVGQFAQVNTNSALVSSIVEQYGPQMVGRIISEMPADASIAALAGILSVTDLSQTNLDWRDFLTWRLVTEEQLIANGNEAAWASLYDFSDEALRAEAYARFNANEPPENYVVISTASQTGPNGAPELLATVYIGEDNVFREEKIMFRLVNNVWLRAS